MPFFARFFSTFLMFLFLLLTTSHGYAQADLTGAWDLDSTALLPGESNPCVYEGSCEITSHDGTLFQGSMNLTLVEGPSGCPSQMMASVLGSLDGISLIGNADGGPMFGIMAFVGNLASGECAATGTFSATEGPFFGTTGEWSAARTDCPAIPAIHIWGLFLMIGLLAWIGMSLLRQRAA